MAFQLASTAPDKGFRLKIEKDLTLHKHENQIHGSVSNQIVKSLSLSYKKFCFFNIVQSIDLIFCKMAEIIEQNIFNLADFYSGPNFIFLAKSIFSADNVTPIKSGNPI